MRVDGQMKGKNAIKKLRARFPFQQWDTGGGEFTRSIPLSSLGPLSLGVHNQLSATQQELAGGADTARPELPSQYCSTEHAISYRRTFTTGKRRVRKFADLRLTCSFERTWPPVPRRAKTELERIQLDATDPKMNVGALAPWELPVAETETKVDVNPCGRSQSFDCRLWDMSALCLEPQNRLTFHQWIRGRYVDQR